MHGLDSQAGISTVTQKVVEDCILTIKSIVLPYTENWTYY